MVVGQPRYNHGVDQIFDHAHVSLQKVRISLVEGFQHDELDLILLRRDQAAITDAKSVLMDHLQRNDLKSAKALIYRCGANLGNITKLQKRNGQILRTRSAGMRDLEKSNSV